MGSGQHNPLEVGAPVGGLDRLGKRGEGGKERGKGGQPVSKLQLLRIVGSAKSSCILTQHININDTYIIRSKID